MNVYLNLFVAAAANLARYRLRSVVVVICLVAICGPYVTGIAISEGIRAEAEIAVQEGADLYLTFDQFGRNGPVPLHYLEAFRSSPHITAVAPANCRPGHRLCRRAGSGEDEIQNWWSSSVWSPDEWSCRLSLAGAGTARRTP